jgi:RHS repeat-associated protein
MTSTLNPVPGGSFFYDSNDRLTTDTYDANGNTISQAGISNSYDFENRMLTHGGVTLAYDGDGNRVSETIGGTTTKFLVDDKNPTGLPQVLDETVSGSVTRTYAHGLQRLSENQPISGTWTPSFYGYDGHGNVQFLTNSAGTITDSYDFDAFGMPIRTAGTTANSFLYSGERLDSSVGLYDLRARYYNHATGRFWAMDPVEGGQCCGGTPNLLPDIGTRRDSNEILALWNTQASGNSLWTGDAVGGKGCCGTCGKTRTVNPTANPYWANPYIYGDDDPVDKIDPLGKEALAIYVISLNRRVVTTVAVATAAAIVINQCFASASEYIKCLNQYLADLFACKAAYPNNPVALANCYKAAKAKFDYCVLTSRGPCQ